MTDNRTSLAVDELERILKAAPKRGRQIATIDLYDDSIKSLKAIAVKYKWMQEALKKIAPIVQEWAESGSADGEHLLRMKRISEAALAFDPLSA